MNEDISNFKVVDLVNKDFGWKGGIKRNITFNYINCEYKKDTCILEPNDEIEFHGCEKKPVSWTGTLVWDGRRLTPK